MLPIIIIKMMIVHLVGLVAAAVAAFGIVAGIAHGVKFVSCLKIIIQGGD
jgi:hypothetical protein